MEKEHPYYLANTPVRADADLEVADKYTGEIATRVALADRTSIDEAIAAACSAAAPMRRLPPYARQEILNHCVTRFEERREELATNLCIEAGKPIKDSRGEVSRLIDTFRIAAGESVRINGEVLKRLSFTGSPEVGWKLKSKAGKKKVVLELGGNAACIVDDDADLSDAVDRMVVGAFYQSGQSCISVQRILIHEAVYDAFRDMLVEKTKALKMGDPKDEDTFIGPVISEADGERLKDWIDRAIAAGGRLLCGGSREGAMVEATLLEDVSKDQAIYAEEAFGPVAVLSKFADFGEALREVNDSVFGLQAGVFTCDLHKSLRAWDELEVGGVVIGDVPSWRVDNMPYGGVKDSGLGREGVRYAIEDMTEIRLLVIR